MATRHPFAWLSPSEQKRAFTVFLALTLAVMVSLNALGRPLNTEVAPLGIISFELAGELSLAQSMVESWGQTGRVYAGLNLGLDYLFMVAYSSCISLGCVLAARGLGKNRGMSNESMSNEATSNSLPRCLVTSLPRYLFGNPLRAMSDAGVILAWAQFGATLLDAVENYALIQVLLGSQQESWPAVARWCAIPKFLIVVAGLVYVGVGAVLAVVTKARRHNRKGAY